MKEASIPRAIDGTAPGEVTWAFLPIGHPRLPLWLQLQLGVPKCLFSNPASAPSPLGLEVRRVPAFQEVPIKKQKQTEVYSVVWAAPLRLPGVEVDPVEWENRFLPP